MRLLYLLTLFYSACVVPINAQSPSGDGGVEMSFGQDAFHAQLQFTTDVVEQHYCSDGSLRFILRLNFMNMDKGPIIIDKRSSVILKYTVSRNSEYADKKEYEIEAHRLVGLEEGMSINSVPNESQFVILKPGETYCIDQVLNFHNSTDGDDSPLRAGNHVLHMVVQTWYYPRASNIKWRNQWQDKGYLWSDDITSVAMPFKIEKKPVEVDCQ